MQPDDPNTLTTTAQHSHVNVTALAQTMTTSVSGSAH